MATLSFVKETLSTSDLLSLKLVDCLVSFFSIKSISYLFKSDYYTILDAWGVLKKKKTCQITAKWQKST